MQFGFTLKPDHTIERTLALTRQAEAAGFSHGWLFDSHVLWREPYPLLTLMAGVTERMRLGTCVTNPGTREPSVTASSPGHAGRDLRGPDGPRASAAATRPGGCWASHPSPWPTRKRRSGPSERSSPESTCDFEGTDLHFPWTRGWTLPVWVAGYGPDGPRDDRARGRRHHPAAGRPGPHRLVRRPGPRRGRGGRTRPRLDQGPGRGTGACRSARPGPRADALVPGARLATTSWTSSTSTRASSCLNR